MAQAVNSSSRTQQIKCALNPDSVLIDGRDCRDRLAFAARFAELILYYNQDNQLSGSWQSFFVKDPVILLAVISKTDYTREHMQFSQLQRNINQTTAANQSVYSASDQAASGQSSSKLASSKQAQSNPSNSTTASSGSQSSNVVALSTAQCIRDNAESINALFTLLERVFSTIDGWIKCMASTNQSYDLYTFMEKSIRESIAKQLWKMVALQQYFSTKTRGAVLPPNTTVYNNFDSVWKAASTQKKPQSQPAVEKPFDALLDQLWSIYNKAFSFFLQVIDSAKQEFYDMKWQENDFPDTSLLISFSELMKTQQKQINLLSRQHLDFYYQDVLKQTLLGAKADQAFVCLELADNIDSLSLPAGTGFSAGVYPDKSTIVFVNDTQSDLNRAKIGEVNTLYYLPSPNPSTLSGNSQLDNGQLGDVAISAGSSATTATSSPADTGTSNSSASDTTASTTASATTTDSAASDSTTDSSSSTASSTTTSTATSASPVVADTPTVVPTEAEIEALITPKLYLSTVTSATEVVKNQDQEIQSWDAFGNTDGVSVQQGFAFGSPMLFLQGGKRTLTITLTLDEMLPTSYFNMSQFYLSTKKDWFEVSATNIQASELVDNNVIILQIVLSEADPAIEAFTKNPDGLSCDWPMFKVMMAASIDLQQHVLLNSVSIQTDVTNFSQFSMGNTTSILPNTGPVQVLGPIPELGSYFYMGSNECFAKPLSALTLVQQWDNIPEYFRDYYAPYNTFLDPDGNPPKDHFNNTAFMGNWSLLEGRSWKILPTQTGTPPPVQMFQQTTPLAVPPALPTKNLPQSTFDFKFDATGTSTTPGVFSLSAPNPDLVKAALPLIEKAQSGYIRFTLCQPAHAFGNDLYPKVVSDITLKNAEVLIKKAEGGGTVAKIMKAVEDAVKSVMKGVSKVVGAITGVVKKLLKTVTSAIKSIVGLVEKAIKTVIGLIKKIIGSVLGLLGKIIKGTVSGIGKVAKGIFNGLKKIVTAPFHKKDNKDPATDTAGSSDAASDPSASTTGDNTDANTAADASTTSAADSTASSSATDSIATVDTTTTDDDTLQPMPNTPYSPKQTALVVTYNATQLTPINDSAQSYPLDIFHYGSFKPYQVYNAVSPKNSIGWSNLVPETLANEQASTQNSGTGTTSTSSTQSSTSTDTASNNSLTSSTSAPEKTLPLFTGVSGQGCLYIGLKEVVAPCAITLYVELNQDADVTELSKDSVGYYYWGESGWEALNILENDTNNLNCSGIIKFEVPQLTAAQVITLQAEMSASAAEATGTTGATATTGTKDTADAGSALSYFPSPIMPNSDFWLAIATQKKNVNVKFSYMNTQAIKLQRSDLTQVPNGETPEIAADIIAALLEKNAKVSTIAQPFPSFNGAPAENNDNYLSRVSQRLESKDRSSSKTNYDDMAHTAYRTLYYAKTLNGTKPGGTKPGKIRIGLVNSYSNSLATNAFRPLVSACQQYTIQSYIASRISAMASVEVFNLKHQVLTVTAHLSLINEGNANAVILQLNQDLKMYLSPWIQSDQPQADLQNGVNRSDLVTLLTSSSSVAGVISLQVMLSPIPTTLSNTEDSTTEQSATDATSTNNANPSSESSATSQPKDTEVTDEIITPQQDNAILVSATKHNLFSVSSSTDSGILNLTPSNELEVAE